MIAKTPDIRLILDNIRSVYNVGSIFRTAECLGVSRIYCVGTTPVPTDRFGRKRKDMAKVALGAEEMVEWEYVSDVADLLKNLKKSGHKIISLERKEGAKKYNKVAPLKAAIVLGNEVNGVSDFWLKKSDLTIEIPQRGQKESLNVSVAAGIALAKIFDRW